MSDHLITILGVLLGAIAVLLAVLQVLLIIVGIISFRYFERISRDNAARAAREEAQIIAARAVTDFMQKTLPAYEEMRNNMERDLTDEAADQIADRQDNQ